jgi:hypothetical protein
MRVIVFPENRKHLIDRFLFRSTWSCTFQGISDTAPKIQTIVFGAMRRHAEPGQDKIDRGRKIVECVQDGSIHIEYYGRNHKA